MYRYQEFQHGLQCGHLAKCTRITTLTRPKQDYTLDDLVSDIEIDLQQRAIVYA